MASTTIPDLPPLLAFTGDELVWVNVNGVDYRMTTAQIATNVIWPQLPAPPASPYPYQTYVDTTLGYPQIFLPLDSAWHPFFLG